MFSDIIEKNGTDTLKKINSSQEKSKKEESQFKQSN